MSHTFEIASGTNEGRLRKGSPNEDSIRVINPGLFSKKPPLLILADGMGGQAGGTLASKMVVETLGNEFEKNYFKSTPREILDHGVQSAYSIIREKGKKNEQLSRMGSTVVAAILEDQKIHVINAGDSRLYISREKGIRQISYDQSIVADMLRQGEITEAEAVNHPRKNELTMSISARRETVTPYYAEETLEMNDVIILCSDGLWGSLPAGLIRAVSCQMNPKRAVKKLIELANGAGGPDNISIIIARIKGSQLEIVDEADD
jgi:PPM family protein phosphatase